MLYGDSPSAITQDILTSSVTTTTTTTSSTAEHVTEVMTELTTTTEMVCMSAVSDSHADFTTDTPGSEPIIRDQEEFETSVVSSEQIEIEKPQQLDRQERVEMSFEQVEHAEFTVLEEKQLIKSSSFEDIYSDTTFELPYGQVKDEVDTNAIGDRFESRHIVSKKGEKTSSYENLYAESQKESKCIEEKDVDERETELQAEDFTRPEKGAWRDEWEAEVSHKNGHPAHSETDQVEAASEEQSHPTALPISCTSAQEVDIRDTEMSRSSSMKSSTPIDVTLESGLDLIGQDQPHQQVDASWERSKSYDSEPSEADDKLRKRHHSTPEHVAQSMPTDEHPTDAWVEDDRVSTSSSEMARLDDIQPPQDMSEEYGYAEEGASAMQQESRPGLGPRYESIEDDEMREVDIEEHQEELAHGIPEHLDEPDQELITGAEGQLETDEDPEMQSSRLILKKQVHKKTIVRDGKEETIVTEDTHIEQENEGPEELQDSMQKVIDQFMEGSDQLGEP